MFYHVTGVLEEKIQRNGRIHQLVTKHSLQSLYEGWIVSENEIQELIPETLWHTHEHPPHDETHPSVKLEISFPRGLIQGYRIILCYCVICVVCVTVLVLQIKLSSKLSGCICTQVW